MYHSNCIQGAKRKFEAQKRMNSYSQHTQNANLTVNKSTSNNVEKDQPVTIICDDSEDVIMTSKDDDVAVADSGGTFSGSTNGSGDFVDKRKLNFDEKLCSVCNINRIDDNYGLDKAEINYMLRFVLHRIRAWVSDFGRMLIINPIISCCPF